MGDKEEPSSTSAMAVELPTETLATAEQASGSADSGAPAKEKDDAMDTEAKAEEGAPPDDDEAEKKSGDELVLYPLPVKGPAGEEIELQVSGVNAERMKHIVSWWARAHMQRWLCTAQLLQGLKKYALIRSNLRG